MREYLFTLRLVITVIKPSVWSARWTKLYDRNVCVATSAATLCTNFEFTDHSLRTCIRFCICSFALAVMGISGLDVVSWHVCMCFKELVRMLFQCMFTVAVKRLFTKFRYFVIDSRDCLVHEENEEIFKRLLRITWTSFDSHQNSEGSGLQFFC